MLAAAPLAPMPGRWYHQSVKVTVNLEIEEFPETELSLSEIMKRRKYSFPHVITRLNGHLVERADRDSTLASDGDDVEIYHLISGG